MRIEDVRELLGRLNDEDEVERRYALQDVQDMGLLDPPDALLGGVIELLDDSCPLVREEALVTISHLKTEKAVGLLIDALHSESAYRRNAALVALSRYGELSVPALVESLCDPSEDVQKFALDGIIAIASEERLGEETSLMVTQAIVPLLTSINVNVAGTAAEALGALKHPLAISPLFESLNSNGWVQVNVLAALSRFESKEARELLSSIDETTLSSEAQTIYPLVRDGGRL